MESQTHDKLFEQIQPYIAVLATQGRRNWDPVDSKVVHLAAAPPVQARLTELDPSARADPDATITAISAMTEAAIRSLPNPYRDAALDHLGFTDQGPGDPLFLGARQALAAKAWGRSSGWYRKPQRQYNGMKPSDYVVALVTCAFCGIPDPLAFVARREGTDPDAPPEAPETEPTRRGPIATVGASDARRAGSLSATMVSRHAGHLEVFWIGPNSEVIYRWWEDGQDWSLDHSWAEPAAVSLTAVSPEPGAEILFGLSPEGRVWFCVWGENDRGWHVAGETQWLEDDVAACGPLASASRGPGMIELFAFDADGKPWHRWTEDDLRFSPWTYFPDRSPEVDIDK
jgi:hypothetical protein